MANFTVTTLADDNDAETFGSGSYTNGLSLREAIVLANANPGADTITFASASGEAFEGGGTIVLTNGTLLVTSATTIDGDVDSNDTPDVTLNGAGASTPLRFESANAAINGLVITAGYDSSEGGGIYAENSTLSITNSTITGNSARFDGGGLYAADSNVTVTNTTVRGNSASDGAGLYSKGGTLAIYGSNISGNSGSFGAGVYGYNSALIIEGTTISGNTVSAIGGGVYVSDGCLTIRNSTITGNGAGLDGGGIYVEQTSVDIMDTTISGNTADGDGGGLLLDGGTPTLTNVTISGNTAGNHGGGIWATLATATLTNVTVSGNTATGNGGGIYTRYDDVSLVNSTVTGNRATGSGDGIYNRASTFEAKLLLTNSIVLGNGTVNIAGSNAFAMTTNTSSINGDDLGAPTPLQVFASVDGDGGGALADNGGLVRTVALRDDPANPAIDAGTDGAAPATDARGLSRGDYPAVANNGAQITDLGAFEVQVAASEPVFSVVPHPNGISVAEGDPGDSAELRVRLTRTGDTSGTDTVTVVFTHLSTDASDFESSIAASFTLTFNPGDTGFAILYKLAEDLDVEPDEQFTVSLQDPSAGTIDPSSSALTLTILNDDGAASESPSLVVTTSGDIADTSDGLTSLREAIAFANDPAAGSSMDGDADDDDMPNDTITFASGAGDAFETGGTIVLAGGPLEIGSDLTIRGDIDNDGSGDVTVDTGGADSAFDVASGLTVSIDGVHTHAGVDSDGIRLVDGDTFDLTIGEGSVISGGTGNAYGIFASGNEADAIAETDIHEITAIVTVQKARIADRAMNAVSDYIASSVSDPVVIETDSGLVGGRLLTVNGKVRSDSGSGAIFGKRSLSVIAQGGDADALLATTGDNAPVVSATYALKLSGFGATLSSTGNNSPLFRIVGNLDGESAAFADLRDIDARTSGINSDAFALGSDAGQSVGNIEVRASDPAAPSVIATSGDGSRAISFNEPDGGSTFTGVLADSHISTMGANAPAIYIDAGDTSSVNIDSTDSTVATRGENSDAIHLAVEGNSDLLLVLRRSTVSTNGIGSDAIDIPQLASSSIGNTVLIDTTVMTEGEDARAFVFGELGGDMSSRTAFIANSSFSTMGTDSSALLFGAFGNSSSSTTSIFDTAISTAGNNARGIDHGLSGDGSAVEITIAGTTIATGGASNSGALILEGTVDDSSAFSISQSDVDYSTSGTGSDAVFIGGGGFANSVFSFDIADAKLATMGDDSRAFAVGQFIAGESSTTVGAMDRVTITTEGETAHGITLGTSGDGAMVNSSTAFRGTELDVTTMGNGARGFVFQPLSILSTGDMTGSDLTVSLNDSVFSTSGNDADGIQLFGVGGTMDSSEISILSEEVDITTTGARSHGFVIGSLPEVGAAETSRTTLAVNFGSISVSGADADAIRIGAGWGSAGADPGRGTDAISRLAIIEVSQSVSATGASGNGLVTDSLINIFQVSAAGVLSATDFAVLSQANGGIENFENRGTISGDIRLGGEDSMLTNSGTITGNIDMGGGTDAIMILSGGLLNSLDEILLGDGDTISVGGTIAPGGDGVVQVTSIGSNLLLEVNGSYHVDLTDSGSGPMADRIVVDGAVTLEPDSRIAVSVSGTMVGTDQPVTILTADVLNIPAGADIADFLTFENVPGGIEFEVELVEESGTTSIVLTAVEVLQSPPVPQSDAYMVAEDEVLSVAAPGVLANDSDPDNDPLTVELSSGSAHGTVDLAPDGSFVFTPARNFNGITSFGYRVSDGTDTSGEVTVTITVSPVNDAPDARNDTVAGNGGSPVTIDVSELLANDRDVDGNTLAIDAVAGATGGTVTRNGDTITFTPSGVPGASASFSYRLIDGVGGSDNAQVTVTNANPPFTPPPAPPPPPPPPVNTLPVLAPVGPVKTFMGIGVQIVAFATDGDGDPLSFSAAGALNGEVISGGGGTFVYLPDSGYSGTDSFSVNVSDGQGGTASRTVDVNVIALPAAIEWTVEAGDGHSSLLGGTGLYVGTGGFQQVTVLDQPGLIEFDPSIATTRAARLFVPAGTQTYGPVPGGAVSEIIGTNAAERVGLAGDANAIVDASFVRDNDTLAILGPSSDYAVSASVAGIAITSAAGAHIRIPAFGPDGGLTLEFADVTLELGTSDGETFVLGGQTITDTPLLIGSALPPPGISEGALLYRGGDVLILSGDARDWCIVATDGSALLSDGDTHVLIPMGTSGILLSFDDGPRTLALDPHTQSYTIGTQVFGDVLSGITAPAMNLEIPGGGLVSAEASLMLEPGGEVTAGGRFMVKGTDGSEQVTMLDGSFTFDDSFARGNDELAFNAATGDFTAVRESTSAVLDSATLYARIAAGTSGTPLVFTNDTRDLAYVSMTDTMTIGTQIITNTDTPLIV